MYKRSLVSSLAVLFTTVGCAGTVVHHQRVADAKSVAVIAYSGEVNLKDASQSRGITGAIGAVQSVKELSDDEHAAMRQAQAEQTYDMFTAKLEEALGWNIAARDEVASNEAMKAVYAEKMEDMSINRGNRFGVPGLLWYEFGRGLSVAEQKELKEALGVDALIVAKTSFEAGDRKGVTISGAGSATILPKAVVSLQVFDGQSEDPIWSERSAQGEPGSKGVTTTMGVTETSEETEAIVEAAGSGYDALIQRFEQARQEAMAAGSEA